MVDDKWDIAMWLLWAQAATVAAGQGQDTWFWGLIAGSCRWEPGVGCQAIRGSVVAPPVDPSAKNICSLHVVNQKIRKITKAPDL